MKTLYFEPQTGRVSRARRDDFFSYEVPECLAPMLLGATEQASLGPSGLCYAEAGHLHSLLRRLELELREAPRRAVA